MDIRQRIRVYALENAHKFKGRANPGALVGRILAQEPSWRSKTKELSEMIETIVSEVNRLSPKEQQAQLKKLGSLSSSTPKSAQKKGLKDLDDVNKDKGVVMRFAPSPSGPMHIGHAMTGGITSLYVRRYGGTYILRIEDTNSDNIYEPAYTLLPEDADWLFGNVSEVWIQSDRLKIYYSYIEKLIKKGFAYVCCCDPDQFRERVAQKKECSCRVNSIEENQVRWKKMLNKASGYSAGQAVLRFKSDMKHKNPAMRDFPLARINDSPHPRQGTKYRVWPLMNLSVFVDDVEAGMTHIIRGKDHADNAKRQEMMYKALDLPIPRCYFQGRIHFEGIEVSCSKTRQKIERGIYNGWDDIRLPFIKALRRRGYQPGAFLRFAEEVGLSQNDKKVDAEEFFKSINSFNKDIIEPQAKRFFFIRDPKEIIVTGSPHRKVELDLHPEHKKGGRLFNTTGCFLIEHQDYESISEGEVFRLMDCLNVMRTKQDVFEYTTGGYEEFKNLGKKIIHWLAYDSTLKDTEIFMPDGTILLGKSESNIAMLKLGEVIQFERFGFCRLDEIDKGIYRFWFAHR